MLIINIYKLLIKFKILIIIIKYINKQKYESLILCQKFYFVKTKKDLKFYFLLSFFNVFLAFLATYY